MLTGILGNGQLGDFQLGSVGGPATINQTVTQTLAFTQTVADYHKSILTLNQSLSLTQAATRGGATIVLGVNQSLSFSQSSSEEDLHEIIMQNLAYIQRTFLTRIGIASNTLTIGQTVVGQRVQFENISQTLTITESGTWSSAKGSTQPISFAQVVALQIVRNLPVSQLLTFRGLAGLRHVASIPQILNLIQTVSVRRIQNLSLTHSLSFLHGIVDIAGPLKLGFANQSIDFIQVVQIHRIQQLKVNQLLNLLQSTNANGVFNFNLSQTLKLHQGRAGQLPLVGQQLIGSQNPIYYYGPPAVATVSNSKNRFVIYQNQSETLTLRTPQLGDNQKYTGSIDLKKTMTGLTYVYVKKSQLNTINYTFYVGRQVALAIENFLILYAAQLVNMYNWKGEVWSGFITNNPFELTAAARYLNESERIDVSIEFTGIKVAG